MAHAVLQQGAPESVAAIGGRDAELRDVSDVVGHAGAQDHPDQRAVPLVPQNP